MRAAQVRRIQEDELEKVKELAASDDHVTLFPTHVVEREGEIIGYISLGAIPTVNLWMHSEKVQARDSVHIMGQIDAIMNDSGMNMYYMPCDGKSPFYPVMEKFGFKRIMKTVLHIKNLGRGK